VNPSPLTQKIMPEQISLKLAIPESQHAALQRHALMRQSVSREQQQLVSIYYDTHRLALRKNHVLLRLRRHGNAWLQTVKRQIPSHAGLTRRPAWDAPYLNRFDFTSVDDRDLREKLQEFSDAGKLTALFESNLRRTLWRLEPSSGVVMMAKLDRGWIASSGRRSGISELELQLVSGGIDALYVVAEQLGARIALTPETVSKAERGYRLFLNIQPKPVKAGAVAIDTRATPLIAFRQIALDCLGHMHRNHAGAISTSDPEYIHQMRVATRRLRAAMRMFNPVLPPGFADQLTPPLRTLMTTLGRARDLDVLIADIIAPVSAALPDEPRIADLSGVITDRLFRARAEAVGALQKPAYGQLLLLAAALLHCPPFIGPQEHISAPDVTDVTKSDAASLHPFAHQRLHRLLKKVQSLARQARIEDPPSLHELRIAIKRLRYAIEFFGPALHGRSATLLVARLAGLQDRLGHLNDLASAGALLMACAGSNALLREAVTLIGGWHGQRHATLLGELPARIAKLKALRLPDLRK
jgi:adenylate cyclase